MALDIELGELLEKVEVEVRITRTRVPLLRLRWGLALLRLAARVMPITLVIGVEHDAATFLFYCTYCGRDFVWQGQGAADCSHCGSQHLAVTNSLGEVTLYPANGPGASR